jgi:large subunit ribosomal protein L4
MSAMVDVPVYNIEGEQIDTLQVDEQLFGGSVNADLLKQAVVTYHANRRVGTAANKNRALVTGTTAKAFRQKGTGRARRGNMKTNLLRGGGVAFRKAPRSFRKRFPKKMRRRALQCAILAKMLAGDLMVVEGLSMDAPRTQQMAGVLRNLKINRSCLLALAGPDRNIYLSSRNLPDLTVRVAADLNAFDVATRQKMLVTGEAMKALTQRESVS